MRKDAMLIVRLPGDMKAALREAAEEDERSVSSLVAVVLKAWLAERGYTARPRKPARRA